MSRNRFEGIKQLGLPDMQSAHITGLHPLAHTSHFPQMDVSYLDDDTAGDRLTCSAGNYGCAADWLQ